MNHILSTHLAMADTTTPSASVTGTSSQSQTGSASASSSPSTLFLLTPLVPIALSTVEPAIRTEGLVFIGIAGSLVLGVLTYMLCARQSINTRKTTRANL